MRDGHGAGDRPLRAVGCEFIDKTLGCASNSPLSLQLNFQAPPGSVARLRLTNVPAGLQPAVGAQVGTVTRVDATTIEIRPGLGTLSGFSSDATRSPVASVTLSVLKQAVEATPNPWLNGPASAAQVQLKLKQVVGDCIADQTSITHFYYPCKSRESVDRIKLDRLESTGAVALIDARVVPIGVNVAQPCASYDGYKGAPFIALPNLFPNVGCLERVTVYGNGNALSFRKESSDALGTTSGLSGRPMRGRNYRSTWQS